jgi:tripartite-type tricarboxylate transporter receptor subunit TctC
VPLLFELATNEMDREVLRFISADTAISRSAVTTPDVPPERVKALRKAFMDTMKDAQFLGEANKMGLDISPLSGEESQAVADRIVAARPEIIERAKLILEGAAK